ncbi:sodium/glutamate symporter [Corallincola luteus]|uniref:Sodium/glutamate symporter n=1 Tax=Corallincola luteus TaxID=1775177 RepID=A0ABY2AP86_9GAMM|nr:sodium/glutamate symporter [Corallincola luteus]TCI04990.1 sodium/glutamate symporter [Corallincola luteus]
MTEITVHGFVSFTLAIILLFIGKVALMKSPTLRKFSIPEPVIGGFLCAMGVGLLYFIFDWQISFKLDVRDWLLLYFFAGIGLKSDIKTLISGGKPLVILTVLATTFIFLQNIVGVSIADLFGMDPKSGLMAGSISLIGGVGTAIAWTPTFVEELGITNASEIGIAANTIGLISACCIGGPIAGYLIKRNQLKTGDHGTLDIGVTHDASHTSVDYYGILWAWLWLNIALIIGHFLDMGLTEIGISLPKFVSCLVAGIVIRNVFSPMFPKLRWPGQEQGLSLISDICLGMFLTMALMSLQLWELKGALLFLSTVMTAQILMSVLFTVWVVFRLMGKDYEASVICSGFGGITLGSTATAIVNMTAVSQQHGAAHRAFIVVPLVCGFFIDIINAIIINFFVGF